MVTWGKFPPDMVPPISVPDVEEEDLMDDKLPSAVDIGENELFFDVGKNR
jgi:hypothetical protein